MGYELLGAMRVNRRADNPCEFASATVRWSSGAAGAVATSRPFFLLLMGLVALVSACERSSGPRRAPMADDASAASAASLAGAARPTPPSPVPIRLGPPRIAKAEQTSGVATSDAPLVLEVTGAKLEIPAGALSTDTKVVLRGVPPAEGASAVVPGEGRWRLTDVYEIDVSTSARWVDLEKQARLAIELPAGVPDVAPTRLMGCWINDGEADRFGNCSLEFGVRQEGGSAFVMSFGVLGRHSVVTVVAGGPVIPYASAADGRPRNED